VYRQVATCLDFVLALIIPFLFCFFLFFFKKINYKFINNQKN
jgi:hypothetical protein